MSEPTQRPRIGRAAGARLAPVAVIDQWLAGASATPGLSDTERAVLAAVAGFHRDLREQRRAVSLSHDRLAQRIGVQPVQVQWAVDRLVELGLITLQPGRGGMPNQFFPARTVPLPR
jgi:hypothetical protein